MIQDFSCRPGNPLFSPRKFAPFLLVVAAAAAADRTLLLVDDSDVLYRAGTRRVLHPARRHPANPLIRPEHPWEGAIGWTSVHRDPRTGKVQVWYQGYSGKAAREKKNESVVCYAESADGIRFTKPILRLFDYNGSRENNIVMTGNAGYGSRYANAVIEDPREPDPSRRYKMTFYDWFRAPDGREYPGVHAAFSPDGIHWTKHPGGPMLKTLYSGLGEPPPLSGADPLLDERAAKGPRAISWRYPLVMSDAADVMFDPRRQVFAIYGKMWIDGPAGGLAWKHGIGRVESRDFLNWSKPELLFWPDDDDDTHTEFHTAPAFFYKDRYFALNQVLNKAEGLLIDIELMVSRDGLAWPRSFRKPYFLPRNPDGGFDGGSIFTNATPVIHGNEMRFYYGAYSGTAVSSSERGMTSGFGMASIPLDRFAGVRTEPLSAQRTLKPPLEHTGQITFKPVDLTGVERITVNADASRGSIRVELLDEDGYRLPGFLKEDAEPSRGDSLAHPVSWRNGVKLPARRVIIRLHLQHAEAFAMTLQGR